MQSVYKEVLKRDQRRRNQQNRIITIILSKEEKERLSRCLTHFGELSYIVRQFLGGWMDEREKELTLTKEIEKKPEAKREIERIISESNSEI